MAKSNELSIDDKKLIVEQFDDVKKIPLACLPDSVDSAEEESYYFVSYSRKDFKAVYKDLFGFQKLGSIKIDGKEVPLRFFYDRGHAINSGESWKKIAEEFISPQPCKGVIFYVSESSLRSEAIAQEMKFAKEHFKQVMTVILPFSRNITYKGEKLKGTDNHSAIFYLDRLIEEEQDENELSKLEQTKKIMSEFISDENTYLSYSEDITTKAKSIANNLIGLPLLKIDQYGVVIGVNNINIREVKESDFRCYNVTGELRTALTIESCAFANCTKLENIELPADLIEIKEYAFYNCNSLNNITIPNSVISISEFAFFNCLNLEKVRLPKRINAIAKGTFWGCEKLNEIDIPENVKQVGDFAFNKCGFKSIMIPDGVREIGKGAFGNCDNLEKVKLPQSISSIGEKAFYECKNLKEIYISKNAQVMRKKSFVSPGILPHILPYVYPDSAKSIGQKAFYECLNLETAKIPNRITVIEQGAFSECPNFKKIILPESMQTIENYAFMFCVNLIDIHFLGTKEQWRRIQKYDVWDDETGDYTVHCTDGDIKKGEE